MPRLSKCPLSMAVFMFAAWALSTVAQAHFIWMLPQTSGEQSTVAVYFAEDASADDPELLKRLDGLVVHQVRAGAEPSVIPVSIKEDALVGPIASIADSLVVTHHSLGVMTRGDATFLLEYYAKTGPALGASAWSAIDSTKHLQLDVVPTLAVRTADPTGKTKEIHVTVKFAGAVVAGAEVNASAAEMDDFTGTTDAAGSVSIPLVKAGVYSIRAKHVEERAGELDSKSYQSVRHYSTVAVEALAANIPVAHRLLPNLPQPVTSFGAAVLNGSLYTYGGHMGEAHDYDMTSQDHVVRRLDLRSGTWETLADGPGLQGLALVGHGDKVYRLGGFIAKNANGEKHDLWSQAEVAAFDPVTKTWSQMPPLPEPRSSFDAAVLGDSIYVVGGWQMAGDADSHWHTTAWALNLADSQPTWTAIADPPFQRRALAVAAHAGKLFAIGGMQQAGGITTNVDIYDPQSNTWSTGPSIATIPAPIEDDKQADDTAGRPDRMTGFGASAFSAGNDLYLTTVAGTLQRLSHDGSEWEILGATPTPRFFHRLLPVNDHELVVVGGAYMGIGKFAEVEVLTLK